MFDEALEVFTGYKAAFVSGLVFVSEKRRKHFTLQMENVKELVKAANTHP